MLITQAAGGTGNILPCSDTTSTLCQASICNCKSTHVNPLVITCVASSGYSNGRSTAGLHGCSISWKSSSGGLCHHLSRVAPKKSLCRLHEDSTSPDDEYRSSRNIAVTLFRRYKNFIDRGGADILKEFIGAGVIAYALGCTDEGLKKELTDMKESGFKIEGMQCYGGNTSLKSKIFFEEATIVRWSSTPPVSEEVMLEWRGFCALIANAYYVRGMAWLPVKILQLEQMAVVGRAEEPSIVASRMQLVFSTLEVVSPQWPRV